MPQTYRAPQQTGEQEHAYVSRRAPSQEFLLQLYNFFLTAIGAFKYNLNTFYCNVHAQSVFYYNTFRPHPQ